jgi:hypothetical protein
MCCACLLLDAGQQRSQVSDLVLPRMHVVLHAGGLLLQLLARLLAAAHRLAQLHGLRCLMRALPVQLLQAALQAGQAQRQLVQVHACMREAYLCATVRCGALSATAGCARQTATQLIRCLDGRTR